jgi:hypothetical protein
MRLAAMMCKPSLDGFYQASPRMRYSRFRGINDNLIQMRGQSNLQGGSVPKTAVLISNVRSGLWTNQLFGK